MDGAEVGIIGGSTEPAIVKRATSWRDGISTDFLRVRAVPFTQKVRDFVETHRRSYVVEMNRDGQLHQLLNIEYPTQAPRLISLAHTDGLPLTARRVVDAVLKCEEMER
jgi:2-oxoglutarate ferredoxin oxidoreductase subunit alpha